MPPTAKDLAQVHVTVASDHLQEAPRSLSARHDTEFTAYHRHSRAGISPTSAMPPMSKDLAQVPVTVTSERTLEASSSL